MTAIERIRIQAREENIKLTLHANEEMVEGGISLGEVLEVLESADLLEDYPEHQRGACCLVGGKTRAGRPLHVVCTSDRPILIAITVYEPKPPKWLSTTQRRPRS